MSKRSWKPKKKTGHKATVNAKPEKTTWLKRAFPWMITVLLIPLTIAYWQNSEPDIRYLAESFHGPEIKEKKVDADGTIHLLAECNYRYKNYSYLKSGFIDRMELAPFSIKVPPNVSGNILDRAPIGPRQTKQVRIQFVMIANPISQSIMLSELSKMGIRYQLFDNKGNVVREADGKPYSPEVWIQPPGLPTN